MVIALVPFVATAGEAQQPTCILQAIEKKLVRDARTNFMKKCEADMQVLCEKSAEQRKLEGPGQTIYIAKCVSAFVGPR